VKTNKHDAADAAAICEAVTRPAMRFVPIKTVEQQAILSVHRAHYNEKRTHQGKMCCGRTPLQTLMDGKSQWKEKVEDLN
ncbi:hypothetical protein ACUHMQ_21150, partial [Chitinimonas sp. PSY-7]